MPTTLTVPNTVTNTVAPYYTVKANDTWTSIATAVYGTADPAVVSALQAATGNPALTVGAHITMPQSLTYSAPIGLSTRTDIQSPLGLVTTLLNDNSGRLISVQSPTVGSSRLETRFVYDTSGNVVAVTEDPSGLNRTTTHQYDSFGNVVLSRDASGNTISRTYSTTNQLLTETRYLTPASLRTR
jgi:YD repeat-containing protein